MTTPSQRFSNLLLGLALLAPVLQAEQWNKHYDVGPNPELRVHAGDASIEMEASDSPGIEATLLTRGWPIGYNGVQVIEHQSGNNVDIEIKVPSMHFSFGERSIRLTLRVPRELTSDIHTGDGSIQLRGVRGGTRVETGDGSVRGEQLEGSLSARTGDGSIHVGGTFRDLQLHTQDGSVEVNIRSGSHLQTGWRIETGDGSVHLGLPKDLAADLELRTGDGHIRLDGPIARENGDRRDHDVRSRLGGGGFPLVVRTGDGSITITAN